VETPNTARPKRACSVFTYDYSSYEEQEEEEIEEEEEQQNYIEMDSKTVQYQYQYQYQTSYEMETQEKEQEEDMEQVSESSCSDVNDHDMENDADLLSFLITEFEGPLDFLQTPSSDDSYSYATVSYQHPESSDDASMRTTLFGY